jgi:hypothetical protein
MHAHYERNEIFFILVFFNHIFKNEPGQKKFKYLTLLSRTSSSNLTYEGVTPVHMARLGSTVSPP